MSLGFYIDDTPLPDSIDPRVLDIDHIEVLRGPQGTLYGARSMGGVVRIITKEPDLNNFSADVHGGVSSTHRTDQPNYTGDGVVNIPLIPDHMALRLSGFYDTEAGYFKRSFCSDPAAATAMTCTPLAASGITTVNDVGEINTYGGAASLTVKLADALTITPRILLQKASYNGFPMADYLSTPGNGIGYPVPAPPQPVTLPTPLQPTPGFTQARLFNIREGGYDAWGLYSLTLHWKTGIGELVSSTAYFSRTVWETEDESDFVYAAITSTVPGGEPQPGPISEEKSYQRFVQEVRFASDLQGPVQFVAGGFYSDFHGRLPFAAYYPPATVPNLDNTLGGQNNPDYANLIFAQDFHTDIREPAAFGELSYQPIQPLKLTAGLRWYQVKISSSGYEEGLATGGGPAIVSPPVTTTESGVNPKFEADYHLTPDQMVYVNAAKGFRPGGLVPIVPPGQVGTQHGLRRGAAEIRSQYHHRRYPQLQVRLAVELRARHQDGLARSPPDLRCRRVLHQVEQHPAGNPPLLRFPVHRQCRRRGEQGRRNGAACAAHRTSGDFGRRGLSECQDHRSKRLVAAAGGFAHLSGARLDRQRLRGVHHGAGGAGLETGQQRRLVLCRQKFQRQQ